jgi:hypothetical protein
MAMTRPGAHGYLEGEGERGQAKEVLMGAPEGSWRPLDRGDGALSGEGFNVRARTQERPDELWLNVQMPDGSWTYLVLRHGDVVAHEHSDSKRDAYERALRAVSHAGVE